MGPSAFAEEEAVRDVKTANPFILLHPESQQAAAEAYYATEEEIRTAVAIVADVALNSSMLYGNQLDMENFMKMFE